MVGSISIHSPKNFGRQNDVATLLWIAGQPFANDAFRIARSRVITIGGIPEGYSQFNSAIENLKGCLFVHASAIAGFWITKFPGAQADIGYMQAGFTQTPVRHLVEIID
jgi:hypothetical protein